MTSLTLTIWTALDSHLRTIWRSALMARLRGALLALTGGASFVALATYHADDPSLNTAGHATVQNALGHFGAVISDIGQQSIGLAAWPASALMVYFGLLRTFHHDPDQTRVQLRINGLYAALVILAFSAAIAPIMTSNDPVLAQSFG
eukprot:gene12300-15655_t